MTPVLAGTPPEGAFLALLVAAGAAPGGAMPGMTRFLCTEGANLATGAAAGALPFLGATILPTGAVSLFSSLDRAEGPVLPVKKKSNINNKKSEEKSNKSEMEQMSTSTKMEGGTR